MRPPICAICDKRFNSDSGGLVSFEVTQEDKEFNKRLEQPGYSGHPTNLEWFCNEHLIPAQNLAHLTKAEALRKLGSK